MNIRRACAYMLMVGGMLLFAGGVSQADQPKSGTQKSGTQSGVAQWEVDQEAAVDRAEP